MPPIRQVKTLFKLCLKQINCNMKWWCKPVSCWDCSMSCNCLQLQLCCNMSCSCLVFQNQHYNYYRIVDAGVVISEEIKINPFEQLSKLSFK